MLLATRHTHTHTVEPLDRPQESEEAEHQQVAIASHCHAGRSSGRVRERELPSPSVAMLGVVGTRRHRQAMARVLVSALVASLPLLYVSLLRPPPAALAGDTAFWFLMSNCVIAAIVATADDDGAVADNNNSVVPLAVHDEPAAFVTMMKGAGGVQEEVAGDNPMGLVASPFLTQAEGADAANKPGTDDLPSLHVSALHVHQDERHETAIEQATDQNNTAVASSTLAPDEAIPVAAVGKRAIVKADKAVTTEPEPWAAAPKLLTSKSLPDQEVQEEEEEAAEEELPVALYSRPPDVPAHGKGGRLRRSVTDGSKSAAEESDYWQLSDEELNRRVEDFIARFNRQMIEQEAGV